MELVLKLSTSSTLGNFDTSCVEVEHIHQGPANTQKGLRFNLKRSPFY